jgi:hypothetical protein
MKGLIATILVGAAVAGVIYYLVDREGAEDLLNNAKDSASNAFDKVKDSFGKVSGKVNQLQEQA